MYKKNEELVHVCCPQHLRKRTVMMKSDELIDEDGKQKNDYRRK